MILLLKMPNNTRKKYLKGEHDNTLKNPKKRLIVAGRGRNTSCERRLICMIYECKNISACETTTSSFPITGWKFLWGVDLLTQRHTNWGKAYFSKSRMKRWLKDYELSLTFLTKSISISKKAICFAHSAIVEEDMECM